jgi:hypothetical protein
MNEMSHATEVSAQFVLGSPPRQHADPNLEVQPGKTELVDAMQLTCHA